MGLRGGTSMGKVEELSMARKLPEQSPSFLSSSTSPEWATSTPCGAMYTRVACRKPSSYGAGSRTNDTCEPHRDGAC